MKTLEGTYFFIFISIMQPFFHMAVRRRKTTGEEDNLRRKLIDLWVAGCRGSEGYTAMIWIRIILRAALF
ncbi:MAG: hypothetical protein JNJ47_03940 [Alphaproteobacteria bacterium]|nr:hypothetical protein [Alphaproteobacteria bacterium]